MNKDPYLKVEGSAEWVKSSEEGEKAKGEKEVMFRPWEKIYDFSSGYTRYNVYLMDFADKDFEGYPKKQGEIREYEGSYEAFGLNYDTGHNDFYLGKFDSVEQAKDAILKHYINENDAEIADFRAKETYKVGEGEKIEDIEETWVRYADAKSFFDAKDIDSLVNSGDTDRIDEVVFSHSIRVKNRKGKGYYNDNWYDTSEPTIFYQYLHEAQVAADKVLIDRLKKENKTAIFP